MAVAGLKRSSYRHIYVLLYSKNKKEGGRYEDRTY